jgi:uncharacterized protein
MPVKVLISGSTGLIGSALVEALHAEDEEPVRLVRSTRGHEEPEVAWTPSEGRIDKAGLEGLDAVVHLAGENIHAGRWTPRRRAALYDSRVKGTRLLAESLAALEKPPAVLIAASAIGWYGNRGDERLDEESPPGDNFLAEICRDWEAATAPAEEQGIRTVHLRIGLVLSTEGGGLAKMLPPFRMGLGGRLGDGSQWISWITRADLIAAILFCLRNENMRGPVNALTPNPVTNRQLTADLSAVLSRPAFMHVPACMVRLLFGEMGRELLLASVRAQPRRLEQAGFQFHHPELRSALQCLLQQ